MECGYTSMSSEITTYKMRPALSQKSGTDGTAEIIVPEHAKHLEPSCTPGSYAQSIERSISHLFGPRRQDTDPQGDMLRLPPLSVYVSRTRFVEDST
jgi:hypothetical protein